MRSRSKPAIHYLGLLTLILFAAINALPANADSADPPDVVVFCEPTLQHAIGDVGALWRRETGVPVRIFSAPTALLIEELSHRPRSDLIIGEATDLMASALQRELIKAPSGPIWRNRLVVAKRGATLSDSEPAPQVDLSTIAGPGPIAIVDIDVATAGDDSRRALQSLGLLERVQKYSIGVVGTEDAAFLLSNGTARLALLNVTDVAANHGLSVVARFPDESYPAITYWLAETSAVRSPNAEKFEAFLRAPAAQAVLRANGLEILP
jgi:molybdate transport system substrate-binding protein